MASLDDVLTTLKNLVVALGQWNQTTLINDGTLTSATVTSATLVYAGSGKLVNYAVVVAGSAAGTINNASTTGGVASSNALCSTGTTVGLFPVNQNFSNGLVITPGSGQSINVSYAPG